MQVDFLHTVLNEDPERVCSWYGLREYNPKTRNQTEKLCSSLAFKVAYWLCSLEKSKCPYLTGI